ncbi:MAG: hypothetical protein K4H23_04500 [Mollicutes bacterium PWAP]|nr:hypothetical protein [Mollicutes bacterium PWAP]
MSKNKGSSVLKWLKVIAYGLFALAFLLYFIINSINGGNKIAPSIALIFIFIGGACGIIAFFMQGIAGWLRITTLLFVVATMIFGILFTILSLANVNNIESLIGLTIAPAILSAGFGGAELVKS